MTKNYVELVDFQRNYFVIGKKWIFRPKVILQWWFANDDTLPNESEIWIYLELSPGPGCNRQHQDYSSFSKESRTKPLFVTVTGTGNNPKSTY